VAQYARYRAPAESGQKLVAPAWSELAVLVAANRAWRARADLSIAGQPLTEFAAEARRELLGRSQQYVASYHPVGAASIAADADAMPLIVTGHQPEMVHPGVWVKNFASATLAKALGGTALNLVIDADACRSTAIRVPAGTLDDPRFDVVEFDGPAEKAPWEERAVVNQDLWHSFADRVASATSSLLSDRLLDPWWPTALDRYANAHRIGASLAQARHLLELQWGQQNLELPQSEMCRTDSFRRFACHILGDLPRFLDAYNGALGDYRRAHHIRNHAHPVSNLERRGPWLQAPFWVWSTADATRRAVFVRREAATLLVSDLHSFEQALPPADNGDYSAAVNELGRWEASGLKLRSRALITTMFVRLAIADLFIHGIGGAKYDEATDAVCERFFGVAPPPFATISGTLRLPIAHSAQGNGQTPRLRQLLRNLEFHPEYFVAVDGQAANSRASELIAQKQRWISTPKTPRDAAQRHEAIVGANRGLQPYVANQRAELELQLAQTSRRARAHRVLDSREYAFCLFPRPLLQHFVLDFSPQAL
jgi:hypothetical protein